MHGIWWSDRPSCSNWYSKTGICFTTRQYMAQKLTNSSLNAFLIREWRIRLWVLDSDEGKCWSAVTFKLLNRLWRVCPGQHFANNSIYIAVASILSVFDITHSRDHDGKEIPVEAAFKSGFFSWVLRSLTWDISDVFFIFRGPEPFDCAITPRSDTARKLLSQDTTSAAVIRQWGDIGKSTGSEMLRERDGVKEPVSCQSTSLQGCILCSECSYITSSILCFIFISNRTLDVIRLWLSVSDIQYSREGYWSRLQCAWQTSSIKCFSWALHPLSEGDQSVFHNWVPWHGMCIGIQARLWLCTFNISRWNSPALSHWRI